MSSGTATYSTTPTLINNTIVQNSCTSPLSSAVGGGLMVATVEDTAIGQNNIVYDNYSTNDPNICGTVFFTYSCVEGGLSGTGNIDEDPLFVTGPDGDYYLSQTAAGQPATSPCVDAGDLASVMITGTTRTDGIQDADIVDMGYHYAVMETPPPPDLSVTLTPHNPPIQIPAAGGSFDFNIAIANNSPEPETFDIWTMVTLPNGNEYGPIINVPDFTAPANWSADRDRTQAVPGGAPTGMYTYDAYVGVYPDNIWNEDHFDFEKLVTGDDNSQGSGWECWGESFDDLNVSASGSRPDEHALIGAHPNPFNPVTSLSFALPIATKVRLSVYDISGRQGAKLIDGWRNAGIHEVTFDGSSFASGVYIYWLEAGQFMASGKMVLIK
jgi:hypothetical protein